MITTKQYTTITETLTRDKHVKTLCDICGQDVNKKNHHYFRAECTIIRECGEYFTESTDLSHFEPDICSDCFEKHIIPFLKSLGVKIQYDDIVR